MQLIVFTSLYPNSVNPQHGIFIRRRLLEIRKIAPADLRIVVVAPVPWAPPYLPLYRDYARIPKLEDIDGITVHHPRYLVIPKLGMHISPHTMTQACAPLIKKLLLNDQHSLLDAHYFYPDGVAAAKLAKQFDLPLTISARGSDITLIAQNFPRARQQIQAAATQSQANIAVAESLAIPMRNMGMRAVHTLRNGVDTTLFYPSDQASAKLKFELNADTPLLCAVGNLVESKGQQHVIRALEHLPQHHLLLAGNGVEKINLIHLAQNLGVAARVHFLGSLAADQLREVYTASDAMVLASAREGWPNVVLEALACGCPVIAHEVGAVKDMISETHLGTIIQTLTPENIATAVKELRANRSQCVAHSQTFAWAPIAKKQWAIYEKLLTLARPR